MSEKDLLVRKIENGTVIDHITAGKGLAVAHILNLISGGQATVVLLNVASKKLGKKDVVKIENKVVSEEEANKMALIAPDATVNIVKNWKVVEKKKISLPDSLENIVKCPNANCITNSDESIKPKLFVEKKNVVKLRCFYCERMFDLSEIKI